MAVANASEFIAFVIVINLKPMKREGRISGRWKKAYDYDQMLIEALNRSEISYEGLKSQLEERKLTYKVILKKTAKISKIQSVINLFCAKRELQLDYRSYVGDCMGFKLSQK